MVNRKPKKVYSMGETVRQIAIGLRHTLVLTGRELLIKQREWGIWLGRGELWRIREGMWVCS